MKQPHTWMEYQYKFSGSNNNLKMWIRDNQRIHQTAENNYITAVEDIWYDGAYKSFDEAKNMLDDIS